MMHDCHIQEQKTSTHNKFIVSMNAVTAAGCHISPTIGRIGKARLTVLNNWECREFNLIECNIFQSELLQTLLRQLGLGHHKTMSPLDKTVLVKSLNLEESCWGKGGGMVVSWSCK